MNLSSQYRVTSMNLILSWICKFFWGDKIRFSVFPVSNSRDRFSVYYYTASLIKKTCGESTQGSAISVMIIHCQFCHVPTFDACCSQYILQYKSVVKFYVPDSWHQGVSYYFCRVAFVFTPPTVDVWVIQCILIFIKVIILLLLDS